MHPPIKQRSAFTLVELLVVVSILAILIALLLPVINEMVRRGYEAKTISNLKGLGVGFSLFAADNDNSLPSANKIEGQPENAYSWWIYRLKPYFTDKGDDALGKATGDPYYLMLLDEPTYWWRPGWGMNSRMGLAVGDNAGTYSPSSSFYKQHKVSRYPSNTILLGPNYWQSFDPATDGTVADSRFSVKRTELVPHNRRIGADMDGHGGRSAFYLTLGGSALNLTPEDAAELLKLRPN